MRDQMLAAVFEGEGRLELERVPVPRIECDDQVLLRVEAASICGTDVHIVACPPRYVATQHTILGHEFTGTVVQTGSRVGGLQVGDRVVVNPNDYCGSCSFCRLNRSNLCEDIVALGIHSDGAFAEFCRVSAKTAHRISPAVSTDVAACAEPLACAVSAVWKANPKPGEAVAVIGAGPIGLLIGMLSAATGARPIMISETAPYRVAFAESLGVGQIINASERDAVQAVRETTGGGADVVFDVVGNQLSEALEMARKGGRVVPFGVKVNDMISLTQSQITMKEISILGSWLANATFPAAVSLLERGVLNLSKLITHRVGLTRIKDGIDFLGRGEAIKVIVEPAK